MHGGCIEARGAIRETYVAAAALLGGEHHAPDFAQQRVFFGSRNAHAQGAAAVDGSGIDGIARANGARPCFTADQALVDFALAGNDFAVARNALARRDCDDHAGLELRRGNDLGRLVALEERGVFRSEAKEVFSRAPRLRAHALVERPADQQEKQKRHSGVEVDLIRIPHRLEEAHARRQQDAERDRHVHVETPRLQRRDRRSEERLARIADGRQCDERRQPVKQLADGAVHVARLA